MMEPISNTVWLETVVSSTYARRSVPLVVSYLKAGVRVVLVLVVLKSGQLGAEEDAAGMEVVGGGGGGGSEEENGWQTNTRQIIE